MPYDPLLQLASLLLGVASAVIASLVSLVIKSRWDRRKALKRVTEGLRLELAENLGRLQIVRDRLVEDVRRLEGEELPLLISPPRFKTDAWTLAKLSEVLTSLSWELVLQLLRTYELLEEPNSQFELLMLVQIFRSGRPRFDELKKSVNKAIIYNLGLLEKEIQKSLRLIGEPRLAAPRPRSDS